MNKVNKIRNKVDKKIIKAIRKNEDKCKFYTKYTNFYEYDQIILYYLRDNLGYSNVIYSGKDIKVNGLLSNLYFINKAKIIKAPKYLLEGENFLTKLKRIIKRK